MYLFLHLDSCWDDLANDVKAHSQKEFYLTSTPPEGRLWNVIVGTVNAAGMIDLFVCQKIQQSLFFIEFNGWLICGLYVQYGLGEDCWQQHST